MSTNQKREPVGPGGGRFAVDPHAEPDVQLAAAPSVHLTSSQGVDDYRFPHYAERRDALTAFDDEAGTYTIGEDLHLRTRGMLGRYWVDSARPILAQLHRAGFAGDGEVYSTGGWPGDDSDWVLRVQVPSGALLTAEARTAMGSASNVGVLCGWHRSGSEPDPASPWAVDQGALDAAVRHVLELNAIESRWTAIARSSSSKPYNVGSVSVHDLAGAAKYLSLEPHAGRAFSTLVTVDAAGDVQDVVEIGRYDRDATWAVISGAHASAPGESRKAMANLGRRLGLGRGADVPDRVEQMLGSALHTASAPDLLWLEANLASQA
jgi:hypothetical protein